MTNAKEFYERRITPTERAVLDELRKIDDRRMKADFEAHQDRQTAKAKKKAKRAWKVRQ